MINANIPLMAGRSTPNIGNALLQGVQANLARESLRGARDQNNEAERQRLADSYLNAALRTKAHLSNNDAQGLERYYVSRAEEIRRRGGDPSETIKALDVLRRGGLQSLEQGADSVIQVARARGLIGTPQAKDTRTSQIKNYEYGLENPGFFDKMKELRESGSTRVNVNTGEPVSLDKSNARKQQDYLVSEGMSLARLQRIKENYDPSFLTYGGRIENAVNTVRDKAGLNLSNEELEALKQRRQFTQSVNQEFNNYRRLVTGAAAAIQELESLKKAMISEDLSPAQFEAAFDEYAEELQRGLRIRNRLVREGLYPGTESFGRNFDGLFFSNAEKDLEPEKTNSLQMQRPQERTGGTLVEDAEGNRAIMYPDGSYEEVQ